MASGLLSLPHRTERTCQVHLLPDDQALYETVKKGLQKIAAGSHKQVRKELSAKTKHENVMVLLNSLRLICNHGEELVPRLPKVWTDERLISSVEQLQIQVCGVNCSSCGDQIDGSRAFSGTQGVLCVDCAIMGTASSESQRRLRVERRGIELASESANIGRSVISAAVRPSAKVVALIDNLREETSISGPTNKPRKR